MKAMNAIQTHGSTIERAQSDSRLDVGTKSSARGRAVAAARLDEAAGWAMSYPRARVQQLCNLRVGKAVDIHPTLCLDFHQSAFKEAL